MQFYASSYSNACRPNIERICLKKYNWWRCRQLTAVHQLLRWPVVIVAVRREGGSVQPVPDRQTDRQIADDDVSCVLAASALLCLLRTCLLALRTVS